VSFQSDLLELRQRRRCAHISFLVAKEELETARKDCLEFLQAYPPKTFRLQEAYRNADGTFAVPHWDEVGAYEGHGFIDCDELDHHIIQEGEWTEVFDNPEDDPRPGYRRVIEVTW